MSCPQDRVRLRALLDAITRRTEHDLTFIAEEAGKLADGWPDMRVEAIDTMLPLLDHPSPLVREGAVYGLGYFAEDSARVYWRLCRVAWHDTSEGVRAAATDEIDDVLDIPHGEP